MCAEQALGRSEAVLARLRAMPGILPKSFSSPTGGASRSGFSFSSWKEGIPRGALTEVSGPHGSGKTEVILRFLAQNPDVRVAWVEERLTIYPCAFPQHGVRLGRVLFSEPPERECLWTVHQILRSRLFGVVVYSQEDRLLDTREYRRLQLAAEKSGASVVLLTEEPAGEGSWPLALQLEVKRVGRKGEPCIRELE